MKWLLYSVIAGALQISPALAQNVGRWSGLIPFPNIPASAAVLPNGQLLTWSSYQPNDLEQDIGTIASQTYLSHYDPASGAFTPGVENSMMADMFCSGISYLADGRVMVNGGSSSFHTAIYDPATDTWMTDAMMNIARGYNSTVTLSTGEAFTLGGSWSGDPSLARDGEIWSAAGGWRTTAISESNIIGNDLNDPPKGDDHAWLFAASNGRVFHAGPSPQMNWIDTAAGSITPAGTRADDPYSINGVAVMYQPGRILKAGGAPSYSNADATGSSYVIDLTNSLADVTAPVVVRPLSPMAYPRAFANGVVLPGGQVLIIGGETHAITFNDDTSVLTPELWDPVSERFTPLAPMDTPRNYHSVALLLPDGRVFSGGGGVCGNGCPVNHQDGELFSPPYLFQADGVTPAVRPAFTLVSSNPPGMVLSAPLGAGLSIPLGATLTASSGDAVQSFELIRLSATTHTVNNDQRRVPLTVTSNGDTTYTLNMPSDPGVVVPGYWMLFALDGNNVPSVGQVIQITPPPA